jgi:hypothetical protein
MQSTLLLLQIRSISLNAPPYTFQNVKVKCLVDSSLRMKRPVIDDSFGMEEADPGRQNFVIRRKGVVLLTFINLECFFLAVQLHFIRRYLFS